MRYSRLLMYFMRNPLSIEFKAILARQKKTKRLFSLDRRRLVATWMVSLFLAMGPVLAQETEDEPSLWQTPESSLHEETYDGVSFSYRLSLGFADHQALAGVALGAELTLLNASLAFEIPVYATLWDFSQVPRSHAVPFCDVLRCDPFVDDQGDFQWTQLSQFLRDVRLGQAEDVFYLRAGPLRFHLGGGQLVNDYVSSPSWNRKISGAYLKLQWPHLMSVEAMTANILAPQELSAVSLAVHPLAFFLDDVDNLTAFLSRFEVGASLAGDLTAPGYTHASSFLQGSRPLLGASLFSKWSLFSSRSLISVTPLVAVGALSGFAQGVPQEGESWYQTLGFGGRGGAEIQLRLPYIAFTTSAHFTYDTERHRSGLFGPFYRLERDALLATSSQGNAADVMARPIRAGWGGQGALSFQAGEIWRMRLQGIWDPDPARHQVSLSSTVAYGTVLFRLAAQTRPLQTPENESLPPLAFAAEAQWAVWGPVSLFINAYRLPSTASFTSSLHLFGGVAGRFVLGMRPLEDWF